MSGVVFRAMVLGLVRDRAALAMTFLLPAIFFVIFASIFAGATGEQLRIKLAIADEKDSDASRRLVAALRAEPALLPVGESPSADQVRELVRSGAADVGLVVRAEGEELGSIGGFGPAPLVIVSDPARGVAVPMLSGQVQKAYFSALPDVALGSVVELLENEFIELSADQRRDLEDGLDELRVEAGEALVRGEASGWGLQDLFEREDVVGQAAALNHVAYYAGGVAVLFLLFSAVHGAISLIEENDSGILDRVLAGPGSVGVLVDGKFLFLVAQGFVQIGVIFLIAWLAYDVDLPRHAASWAITTLAASVAAAGLALTLAAACRTRRQAQTFANVAILVLSALGGSMVPRFFMPQALQELGWITPNTWAIEAYTAVFWRNEPMASLVGPWIALAAAGLLGLLAARVLARRRLVG
jgi:ABC-2 type transport system permease protein